MILPQDANLSWMEFSESTRKHWQNVTEKYDMHQLTWDLVVRIAFLLEEAKIPPDDAITDFADETKFTQIYNIAQYADAFADIALKACTLAHTNGIDDDFFELRGGPGNLHRTISGVSA